MASALDIYAGVIIEAHRSGSPQYLALEERRDHLCEQLRNGASKFPRWRSELVNLEMGLALAAPSDAAAMYWIGIAETRPLQLEDSGEINQTLVRAMFARLAAIRERVKGAA